MDHVVIEFYLADKLLKSESYQCGRGQAECPEPRWEGDPYDKEQFTRAHFPFTVPEKLDPAQEYEVKVRGETKTDGQDPIWQLQAKFTVK